MISRENRFDKVLILFKAQINSCCFFSGRDEASAPASNDDGQLDRVGLQRRKVSTSNDRQS